MVKVKLKSNDKEYAMLGTGYGMFRAQGPTGWTGFPKTNEGSEKVVAICSSDGEILWAKSEDVYVVSIDGVAISEVF